MDLIVSVFYSEVLSKEPPNLENFKVLCCKVDVKSLNIVEIHQFVVMILYTECQVLSTLVKTAQSIKDNLSPEDYLSQLSFRAKSILEKIDGQLSFFENERLDVPVGAIKLAVRCMKRNEFRNWPRYLEKLLASVRKLTNLKVPIQRKTSDETQHGGAASIDVLLAHLTTLPSQYNQINTPNVLSLSADVHPALLLDDISVKLSLENLFSRLKKQAYPETSAGADEILSSCIEAISSTTQFLDHSSRTLSIATQTDEQGKPDVVAAQSTPVKDGRQSALRILYDPEGNFIDDTLTPANSPEVARGTPVAKIPTKPSAKSRKAHNLSLTLVSAESRDDASLKGVFPRRRKPWTLSETLMLWHEVQLALPHAPSWARIRDHAFRSSGRTNVDLKDRWRVIQRDPVLQTEIRSYYEQWLATRPDHGSKP